MLSRPLAEDFQPLEVAKVIMGMLTDYEKELSVLRHLTRHHEVGRKRGMGR